MANRYYGVPVGGGMPTEVTEGSSTTSKAVELNIDLSAVTDKVAALKAIEAIEYKVATDPWPPA